MLLCSIGACDIFGLVFISSSTPLAEYIRVITDDFQLTTNAFTQQQLICSIELDIDRSSHSHTIKANIQIQTAIKCECLAIVRPWDSVCRLQSTLLQPRNSSYPSKQFSIDDGDLCTTINYTSCYNTFNQYVNILLLASLVVDPNLSDFAIFLFGVRGQKV